MRNRQSLMLVLCVALALALVAPAAWAQALGQETPNAERAPQAAPTKAPAAAATPAPMPKDWSANVRVDVTITDATRGGASTQKSISVTVRNNGRGSSVRSGVSLPVPSTTFAPMAQGGVATVPMTSWQYKDMGLSLDVTSVSITDNFVTLRLGIEYNASALPAGQPSFAQFRQNLDIVLESGKPLVVATSSDPVPSRDRKASLEVKATILR